MIPKTLDEAVDFLYDNLTAGLLVEIQDLSEDEFVGRSHFGHGTWIRNSWGLWSGSELSRWFQYRGIFHADDMSSIILTSSYRKIINKPINLDEQVLIYKKYWINEGIDPSNKPVKTSKFRRFINRIIEHVLNV
jgi:hypothetical protein